MNVIVGPGDLAVDVGAHNGLYTRALARAGAKVLAFEPFSEVGTVIQRTTGDSVTWKQIAISACRGLQEIKIPLSKGKPVFGYASMAPSNFFGDDFEVREVPVSTIDSEVSDACAFIKVDVEGHELDVLTGATETIRKWAPVFLIESESRHSPGAPQAVFEFFEQKGYEGYFIHRSELVPTAEFCPDKHQNPNAIDFSGIRKGRIYLNNFFFFPPGSDAVKRVRAKLAKRGS